jgi:hypothetical protein
MFPQTETRPFVVTQDAQEVITLLRKHHYYPRLITDFSGPITSPIMSTKGDMVYMEIREADFGIIPKRALAIHQLVKSAGFRDLQVIIGHEIRVAPEKPLVLPKPKREINWGSVAAVTSMGLLVAAVGMVMVPIFALAGAVTLLDPSYCIVLDDGTGTVIELLQWNDEV